MSIVNLSKAVRDLCDLEATERALNLALLTADETSRDHITAALNAITDARGAYQSRAGDARLACTQHHRVLTVNDLPIDMPAGYTLEQTDDFDTVWHHGQMIGRSWPIDGGKEYVVTMFVENDGTTGGKFPTRNAAIKKIVSQITE